MKKNALERKPRQNRAGDAPSNTKLQKILKGGLELSDADIQVLESSGCRVLFKRGQTLINEGEDPNWLGIVVEGQAEACKVVGGKRVFLGYVYPGDTFGEAALLIGEQRRCYVVASRRLTILKWMKEDLLHLMTGSSNISRWIAHRLFHHLQSMNTRFVGRTTRGAKERVLEQYATLKKTGYPKATITEIARQAGVSRETASRYLKGIRPERKKRP